MQLGASSAPGLGAETAATAAEAEEMAGTGAGVDAGSRASHWASVHNAVVAGAAGGGGAGDDGSGGAAVTVDAQAAARTAAGDVVTV